MSSLKQRSGLFSVSVTDRRRLEVMLSMHMEKQKAAARAGAGSRAWGESELEVRLQGVSLSAEFAARCFLQSGMRLVGAARSEVSVYDSGVRMVRNPDTGAEIWEEKKQNGLHVMLVPKDLRQYSKMPRAKIVLATETPLSSQRVRLEMVRRKKVLERHKTTKKFSVDVSHKGAERALYAEIHLSSVNTSGRRESATEVEIEFSFLAFDQGAPRRAVGELCSAVRAVYDALFANAMRARLDPAAGGDRTLDVDVKKHGFLSWTEPVSGSRELDALLRAVRGEPKPYSLAKSDLRDVFVGQQSPRQGRKRLVAYAVTNKLDGMKVRLVLMRGEKPRLVVGRAKTRVVTAANAWKHEACVLDCEAYRDRLWCFDVALVDGTTRIQKHNLTARLAKMEAVAALVNAEVSRSLDVWRVTVKTFFSAGSVYENLQKSRACVARQRSGSGGSAGLDNDGFIFVQTSGGYMDRQWKWKPPYMQTIDMRVEKTPSGLYDLLVAFPDKNGHMDYKGSNTSGIAISRWQWDRIGLRSDEAGKGQIVEFSYKVSTGWEPLVWRSDKRKANFFITARSVWDNILEPLGERELVELLRVLCEVTWRQFHNKKKMDALLAFLSGGETVLDIGIGRGGDIGKFMRAGAKKVFGIDPNEANLAELEKRMAGLSGKSPLKAFFETSVKVRLGDGGDVADVGALMGGADAAHSADVVTSMFSLTFFFDTLEGIHALVSVVDWALKPGGYFMGVTMDGSAIQTLLEGTDAGQTNCSLAPLCIEKRYGGADPLVGRTVVVNVEERGTMVEEQTEWLVYESVLTELFAAKDIELVMWEPFLDRTRRGPVAEMEMDLLGKDARNIVAVQSSFAFRKRGGGPPLFPELVSPSAGRLGLGSVQPNWMSDMTAPIVKAVGVIRALGEQQNWGLWSGVLRVSQLAVKATRIYFVLEVAGVMSLPDLAKPAQGMDATAVAVEFGKGSLDAAVRLRVAAQLRTQAQNGYYMSPEAAENTNSKMTRGFVWCIEQAFLEARDRAAARVAKELETGTLSAAEQQAIVAAVL